MEEKNNEYISIGSGIKDIDDYINSMKYLREHSVEEIVEEEKKFWTKRFDDIYREEKKKLEENEENNETVVVVKYGKIETERRIKERINYALNEKKEYDSMSDEEFEKNLQLMYNKRKIDEKIGRVPYLENYKPMSYENVAWAISNVRYMTETDMNLKKHIKSEISQLVKDKTYLGFLIFPGIAGGIPALIGFIESNQKLISSSPIMFSLALATMVVMYGHKIYKDWSCYVQHNPHAIEKLKEAGIYELVLQQLQIEKEYEEVKKRRG